MCARRTARSFGSSTEIVSRASLQSRRSERGRRGVVVQGCWTSWVRKASRLSSWAMDRSMRTGDPFDMTVGKRRGRCGCKFIQLSSRWQVPPFSCPHPPVRTGITSHGYCIAFAVNCFQTRHRPTPGFENTQQAALTAVADPLSPRRSSRSAAPAGGTRGCAGRR